MATYTVSRKLPGMGFSVSDDTGTQVYAAKHHAGFKEERWDLTDLQGQPVATLTLQRIHAHPTYVVTLAGQQPITVTRDSAYAQTWSLDGSSGSLRLVGDTGAYDWRIVDSAGTSCATGQRKAISEHQRYSVSVEGDPALALCVAVAIASERMHGRESVFGALGQF